MKVYSEDQLLDISIRKLILDECNSTANVARKKEAKKRHDVMKDKTVKYVMEKLELEGLRPSTLQLMKNRASNISICRKIVNKLARAYQSGVQRDTGEGSTTIQVAQLAMLLNFDAFQKKADKFLKLQRNCLWWAMPERTKISALGEEKYIIKNRVFGPWQYDAVENSYDPECPIAIILSDYTDGKALQTENKIQYIWWGNKYHFTTNRKGEILRELSPPDLMNPIQEIPGVAMARDRDDCFWATGGEDLVDGSILINTMLTDMNAIMFTQGWGQMVVTGPKGSMPQVLEGGPHNALVFEYDAKKDEPAPEVTVVNSNPPVESWMRSVEQYTAILLSTNGLSPSSVAGKLDASNIASGIALLIEKSESTEDVRESQNDFARYERRQWRINAKWHNLFLETGSLEADYEELGPLPEDIEVTVKFNSGQEVISEKERLENMKLRKELGLLTKLDMIMLDNPNMTEEEAKKKAAEVAKEQLEASASEAARVVDEKAAAQE